MPAKANVPPKPKAKQAPKPKPQQKPKSERSRGRRPRRSGAGAVRGFQSQSQVSVNKAKQATIASVNKMVRAPFQSKILQAAFKKITLAGLDDPEPSPLVPAFPDLGDERFFEATHHKSIIFNPHPVQVLLGTPGTPEIGSHVHKTYLYPSGSVPIVATHDALTMAIFPVVPSGTRAWVSDWTAYEGGEHLSASENPFPYEQMLMGIWATTASGMPSDLGYRPITASLSKSENQTYVWIDAADGFPAMVDLRLRGGFTPGAPADTVDIGVIVERFDGRDQPVEVLRDFATFVGLVNAFDVSTAVAKPIYTSGYYHIRVVATCSGVASGTLDTLRCTMTSTETTTLATAHLLNLAHQFANNLTRKYWLAGSGVMVSPRFPTLTVQGSILGAQLDPLYTVWYQGTIDGEGAVYNRPNEKIFGSEGGCKLTDGVWAFGTPAQYPSLLDLNTMDLTPQGTIQTVQGNFRPSSYILPSDSSSTNVVGMKIIFVSCTADADLRILGTRIIDYTAESQIVRGLQNPFFPLDDWAALLVALRKLPVMTTNDWHTFLEKVSVTAGKFAYFLQRLAEGTLRVAPVISTAARLAAEISDLAV